MYRNIVFVAATLLTLGGAGGVQLQKQPGSEQAATKAPSSEAAPAEAFEMPGTARAAPPSLGSGEPGYWSHLMPPIDGSYLFRQRYKAGAASADQFYI